MAHVVEALDAPSSYRDTRSTANKQEQQLALAQTSTLYVGNLSFYTTEEQMHELFGRAADPSAAGGIRRIIMGLDRNTKTPCGFAFVEYYTHDEAVDCMRLISGTKLDERVIRCDLDPGYKDGRQYGRGRSGGQVRDEYRQEYDAGRGGWGHNRLREDEMRRLQEEEEERRRKIHEELYQEQEREEGGRIIPEGAEGQYEEWNGRERMGEDDEDDHYGRNRERDRYYDGEGYSDGNLLTGKRARSEDQEDGNGEDAHQSSRLRAEEATPQRPAEMEE